MIIFDQPSTFFRCFFIIKTNARTIKYRVDGIVNIEHPFKLLKNDFTEPRRWDSLSVYASVRDCVGALLNDLFPPELRDEINHGQATIDSRAVLSRIEAGQRCIVIYQTTNSSKLLLQKRDIKFEDLVIRQV